MAKDRPTIVVNAKVWVAALALLGAGTAGGGVNLFRSLTPADVSKQIADETPAPAVTAATVSGQIDLECSYLEDRALVMHLLAEAAKKEAKLFEKIDEIERNVTEALIEQRTTKKALDRIEIAIDKLEAL